MYADPIHHHPRPRFSPARLIATTAIAGIAVIALAAGINGLRIADLPASAYTTPPAEATTPASIPTGFADLVAKVRPAVFAVRVDIGGGPAAFTPFGPERSAPVVGEGSGFFVSPDGYAITNDHVIDHARDVQITTDDGSVYGARVVAADPKTDLALLKVDAGRPVTYVKFADRSAQVGDWVVAVGNPFGLGNTVTAGIVSALNRDVGSNVYDRYMQIDAPINQGNSGGPTFDVNGHVVGVNTLIYTPSGGSVGIGFDIPADQAKSVADGMIAASHSGHGWFAGL